MRDLNIFTQEPSRVPSIPMQVPPPAAEASYSTSMASSKESVEGFNSVQMRSSSVSFGSIKVEKNWRVDRDLRPLVFPLIDHMMEAREPLVLSEFMPIIFMLSLMRE